MAILSMHFENQDLDEFRLAAWHHALRDLTDEQFRIGLRKFLTMHTDIYPNTNIPACIRQYGLWDEFKNPSKAEAWGLVMKEICNVGGNYGIPKIKQRAVQKAVEILGWANICQTENQEATRAHFFQIYESLVNREKQEILACETLGEA